MAKPRTNYEAVQRWADSILTNEPASTLTINSIVCERDTVYSFGYHYPMGKIFRRPDGSVRRVVVTNAYYPSRGFASTPTDQGNVESCAREACRELGIEMEKAPLSSHGFTNGIPCLPKASDPQLARPSIEVRRAFAKPTDPGPEPVHDTTNCIAGREDFYSYQEDGWVWEHTDLKPWEHVLRLDDRLHVRRASNGVIVYTDHRQNYWSKQQLTTDAAKRHGVSPSHVEFKVCPCCAAFRDLHEVWSNRMHGYSYGVGRRQGWKQYHDAIETYGSEEAWREARREDIRRVRAGHRYIAAWTERNFIPLHAVSTDEDGIPILDSDGRAMRKDSEAYFKRQRDAEREERRRQRERDEQERIRRIARRAWERRQARRQDSFIGRAHRVASELHAIRLELAANATNGLQSDDSNPPGGTTA